MGTGEFNAGGNPAMDWHPIQGGVEIFLVASCHGNRDKLRPDEPLGSYADFTFTLQLITCMRTLLIKKDFLKKDFLFCVKRQVTTGGRADYKIDGIKLFPGLHQQSDGFRMCDVRL